MAVLGRLLLSSAERIDLPDMLSIDSYAAGDWKYFLKGLVGDTKPFVLKGFDVIDPQNAIGTQSCSIRVADSMVFYPGSNAGSFYHGLEEGNPNAAPLVPELRKNATNFVYLTFSTFNTSIDTRAFWDPDKDGGAGGEFTQDVNTESVLKVEVNVSTGSFPANTIPVAKITVGAVVITSITDCRDQLFRLGTGGINPDPFHNFEFRSLPNSTYQRSEPPITMFAGGDNPFQGGDKNIYTLKEWMDLVMSKFKELSGTTYWYEDLSSFSLISGFIDALATTFKSKGQWQHSAATAGLITWTEDIQIKITQDPRDTIIRAGNKTLNNEEVAYVALQRNKLLNASDQAVQWTNGQPYVNTVGGAVGYFANLSQGDYIKKVNDPNHLYLRVEQFYDSVSLGGSTTTAANARSVRLSAAYQGSTTIERGRYDKGVYQPSDVVVSARSAAPLSTVGGNFHWIALRSDVIENIGAIDSVAVTGTLSDTDGSTARIDATAHGLVDGDYITVTAPVAQAGTYQVEVESANVFFIQTTNTTDGAFTGYYATVTTAARDNGYGLQLESANHGFDSGDKISIAATTSYNGSYLINKRSDTQFQFAFGSDQAAETSGTATMARVNVRAEQGLLKLVQGENVDIGDGAANNIKKFIGMGSLAETHPIYNVSSPYNTLFGMHNYNSAATDNLTARVSKLTAMMADKSQDKMVQMLPSASLTSISNTTNGANQEVTFSAPGSTLTIVTPGSNGNAVVALPSAAPGISLAANQVAYVDIDRNSPTTPTILTSNIVDLVVGENTFIVATRLSTTDVYIWDYGVVPTGSTPVVPLTIVRQNQSLKLIAGGIWNWDLPTSTVSWSTDAFIQVLGLANSVNQIVAGSAVLAVGDVAYVDINRAGPGGALTVVVAPNASVVPTDNRFVIARRVNNNVIIGAHSIRLNHQEPRTLYGESNKVALARLMDNVSTSLPSGPTAIIDGIAVANSDRVFFNALTAGPTRGIYVASGVGTSIVWTKLGPFNGSDLPYNGATLFVQEGTSVLNSLYEYDGIAWRRSDAADVTGEQTGFPNQTDSTLSFNNGTRTFTITPAVTSFDYYCRAVRYRKSVAQSVVIPNVEGLYFIYFSGPTLSQINTFSQDLYNKDAWVATVYWDATNQVANMVGDERHGLSLDWATHQYLHTVNGTQIDNGFAAGNFTIAGTGATDADVELSIANGRVFDEDLIHSVQNNAAPTLPFQQVLTPIAKIPVYYRDGAQGYWRKNAAVDYPLMVGTLPKYNLFNAGTWTQPDATNTRYVAMWVFATNNQSEPVIALMGQRQDTSLANAQANNSYESLSFGLLPSQEMKVLFRLIYLVNGAFANTAKAALRDIRDLRKTIDASVGAYAASDHGLLTGLTDQDHPASAIFTDVANFNNILSAADTDVQKALDTLDNNSASTGNTFQDRNAKMVKGGTWGWSTGTNLLTLSLDAFIQVPGLPEVRNQINAGTISLTADGQVAWVDINRVAGAPASLTVQVGAISGVALNADRIIIARRTGNDVLVGSHSMLLINGESKALDAGTSIQGNLFTGADNNADSTPDYAVAVPHTLRYIAENTSLEVATSRLDDQIDKLFGQLRLRQEAAASKRVLVTGAETSLLDGTTLSQQTSNLLLNFTGAQIQFETGVVYAADGVTPLGVNFTPAVIASGQYRWYSVSLIPTTTGSDNRISVQLTVTPAASSGASPALAPRATFTTGVKLGQVVVQGTASPGVINVIPQSQIVQLGSGSGGSGDGSGNADEFLETLKNYLESSNYTALVYNIPSLDTDDKLDPASTATYDGTDGTFNFTGVGQTVLSTNLLDADFIASARDVDSLTAVNKWVLGQVNTTAVYQASRDGGAHWQTIDMERISATNDTYQGDLEFDAEQDIANQTFATTVGNLELTPVGNVNERLAQQIELLVPTTLTQASLRLSKVDTGGLAGNYRVQLVQGEYTATQLAIANATLTTTDFSTPASGYIGQSFTTPAGAPKFVKSLTIFLKGSSVTEHAPIKVGLMDVQGGVPLPNTVRLADTTLYTDEIPAGYTQYTFTWNTPIRLLGATTYAWVVQDYKIAGNINIKGNLTDTFAGGNLFSLDGDGAATQFATFDLAEWSLNYETRSYQPGSGVIASTAYQLATGLTTGATERLVNINSKLAAGVYFVVVDTDAVYKASYASGTKAVRVHGNLTTGNATASRQQSGVWSSIASGQFAYNSYGTIDAVAPAILTQTSETQAVFLVPASSEARSQVFNITTTQKIVSKFNIVFNKVGNPTGNMRVKIVKDNGANVPSLLAADTLWAGPYENLTGVFDGVRSYYPNIVLSQGLHHVVIEGDSTYLTQYTTTSRFGTRQLNGLAPNGGASQYNGTTWGQTTDSSLYLYVEARTLDLRYRVTAGSGEMSGYGVLYDRPLGTISDGSKQIETFTFTAGNTVSFTLSKFMPDPSLLVVYLAQTGQAFRYPAFDVQGQTVVFPTNAFGGAGQGTAITLVFDQTRGGSYDNSDVNASLLAANHLGSSDGTISRAAPGRGPIVMRPDGVLVEITVDNNNNIAIYSLS